MKILTQEQVDEIHLKTGRAVIKTALVSFTIGLTLGYFIFG